MAAAGLGQEPVVHVASERGRYGLLRRALLLVACAVGLALAAPALAGAATITVDSTADNTTAGDSSCTLREAVANANGVVDTTGGDCTAGSGADEITFSVNGTVTLTLGSIPVSDPLTITGNGQASTIIDGNNASEILSEVTAALTVEALTLRNGNAVSSQGGAIEITNGNLIVRNSAITANHADDGGGGILGFGDVTIENSTLSGNTTNVDGGAVAGNAGTIRVTDSQITGNTADADSTDGGTGGGIWAGTGTLVVTSSTISSNSASSGGGIQGDGGVTVTASTISDNRAEVFSGGGILASEGNVLVVDSVLTRNVVPSSGGAIRGSGDPGGADITVTVRNSTVSDNSAGSSGGGIRVTNGSAVLTHATVTDNTPGGVVADPLTLTHSIVADNADGADCSAAATSVAHSFDSDGSCGAMVLAGPDAVFALPAANGGPTDTVALPAGHSAVDAVPLAACQAVLPDPPADQRGVARPQWNPGGLCDAGAFELEQDPQPLTVVVTKTAIPSVVRSWVWSVAKRASHERVVLARKKDPGLKKDDSHLSRFAKQASVEYRVGAWAESVDSAFRVSGVITVSVPGDAGGPAEITDVVDVIAQGLFADVTCERDLPAVVAVGESLRCEYVRDLPDGELRSNTAFVTAQVPGQQQTEDEFQSDPVLFDFDDPLVRKEVDERARVYDSRAGFLGWVDADTQPTVFTYNVLVAPGGLAPLCGKGYVNNTASVVANETGAEDRASVRIPVEVLCFVAAGSSGKNTDTGPGDLKPGDPGVSVTKKGRVDGVLNGEFPPHDGGSCLQGKDVKRGSKGDPLWQKLGPNGKQTRFFKSKGSYRQALVAKAKSPYNKLSRVYVLAKLNVHAGAPIAPATTKALRFGDRYFASKAPNAKIGKKQKRAIAKHMKSLKRFNKMARGHHPPACAT